jgi:hypothetical protein
MPRSDAATVDAYLDELPEDRRATLAAVRDVVLSHLPEGYTEGMAYGMIGWAIPLSAYPDTYNKQPLGVACLAAQKRYNALYLNFLFDPELEARLRAAFSEAGKKLDMGKACVRFKTVDDLPLEAIGRLVADVPPERLIAAYESSRN